VILITWLSSRGTFMFLDSVAFGRAEISKPWRENKREGNSLFLWRLVFGFICWVFFIVLVVGFFTGASFLYNEAQPGRVPVLFIAAMVMIFLLFLIVTGYISLFLTGFVAPLQLKHRLTATQAWRRFLSIFGRHPFHFLLFGIFHFVLSFTVVMLIIFAGIITCCIGFLILIIPYVGTVATLPIWYTLRAFSLEYLAQFGPDFDLFPAAPEAPQAAAESA
jgi:hypothetical protein